MKPPAPILQSFDGATIESVSVLDETWALVRFSNDESRVIPLELLRHLAINVGVPSESLPQSLRGSETIQ